MKTENITHHTVITGTVVLLSLLCGGCATEDPSVERGPDGTVAYSVSVEASEPGTKIEINGKVEGIAPLTLKIFGDRDGTFHNFGSDDYTVRAYPPRAEQYPQSRIFKTGTFGIREDKIPQKIYFDFSAPGEKTR
jgi:hypothetical protein